MSKRTTTGEFNKRQDVHVNRIYPIMIMCEMYLQSILKPPECILIADIKTHICTHMQIKKKGEIYSKL